MEIKTEEIMSADNKLANGMTHEEWQKEVARIKVIKRKNGELLA